MCLEVGYNNSHKLVLWSIAYDGNFRVKTVDTVSCVKKCNVSNQGLYSPLSEIKVADKSLIIIQS